MPEILVSTGESAATIVGFEVGTDCIVGNEMTFATQGFFLPSEIGVFRTGGGTLAGRTTRSEVSAIWVEMVDDLDGTHVEERRGGQEKTKNHIDEGAEIFDASFDEANDASDEKNGGDNSTEDGKREVDGKICHVSDSEIMGTKDDERQNKPSEGKQPGNKSDDTIAFKPFKGGNLASSFTGNIGNKRSVHRIIILYLI